MIRQPQRRLYFESETEEFYWERSRDEAEELGRRLGFDRVSGIHLRNLPLANPSEPKRNDPKASDTASINTVRGGQRY